MEALVTEIVKEEVAAAVMMIKYLLRKSQLKQMEHLKKTKDPVWMVYNRN